MKPSIVLSGQNQKDFNVFSEIHREKQNLLNQKTNGKMVSQLDQELGENLKDFKTSFNQTNPFYYLHRALYKQSGQQGTQKHNLLGSMKLEIKQMKQVCQKLMIDDDFANQYNKKTLIMDLQDLQSRRTNIDEPSQQSIKSQVSIKYNLQEVQKKQKEFQHKNCCKINSILQKAQQKIQQLTKTHKTLQEELQNQQILNKKASYQNESLRQQIAKLDDIKCSEIEKLKRQLQKLNKNNLENREQIFKVGRISTVNDAQQKIHQNTIPKVMISLRPKQLLVEVENQKTSNKRRQNTQSKLKNLIYL